MLWRREKELFGPSGAKATHLSYSGIFSDCIIYTFSPDSGSEFENRLIFGKVIRRTKMVPIFGPPCM